MVSRSCRRAGVAVSAISVEDAMIAATARAYALSVVTRNGADFAGCGVPVVDPWLEDEA